MPRSTLKWAAVPRSASIAFTVVSAPLSIAAAEDAAGYTKLAVHDRPIRAFTMNRFSQSDSAEGSERDRGLHYLGVVAGGGALAANAGLGGDVAA